MRIAILAAMAASFCFAQPTLPNAVPMPTPEIQYLDAAGKPLAGGKLCTYLAGTSTPLATYTDSTAGTPNTNPVVLNTAGRASVWVGPALYKFVLRTGGSAYPASDACTTGTIQWTQDNVSDTTLYFANYVKTVGTCSLITFTATGTGAVTRTCSSKLEETISVKDFGAIGDGTSHPVSEWCTYAGGTRYTAANAGACLTAVQADYPHVTAVGNEIDWAAIQAANNAAQVASLVSKVVHFPGGEYQAGTSTLTVTDQVIWQGESERGTHIYYSGTGTAVLVNNGTSFIYHIHFRDLRIVSTASAGAVGVAFKYVSESYLEYVTVRGFAVGVLMQDCNNMYLDRYTSDLNTDGVYFQNDVTGTNNFISIKHGNFFDSADAAIKTEGNTGLNVIDNYFEYFSNAIKLTNSTSAYFEFRNFEMRNNWFLTQNTTLFPSPKLISTDFSSGKAATITNMTVAENYADLWGSPYLIDLIFAGTVTGSYAKATIQNNFFTGATTSTVYADSMAVALALVNNRSYEAYSTGTAIPIISGTAAYSLNESEGGTYVLGLSDISPTAGMYASRGTNANRLPAVITDAAIIGENKNTMGTGTGKIYGILGVATGWGDASGDQAYGGYFKGTAENNVSTEVGVHAEVTDTGGTIYEGYQGGNLKFRVDGTGTITKTTAGGVLPTITTGDPSPTAACIEGKELYYQVIGSVWWGCGPTNTWLSLNSTYSATTTCPSGQAIKAITIVNGHVTASTCGAP